MARMRPTTHAERALQLLMGMRLPRVQVALRPYGWNGDVLRDGWARLADLSVEVEGSAGQGESAAELRRQLEAFRSQWFPIAGAVLVGRAPEFARWLFAGVRHGEGQQVVVEVATFLERLRRLAKGASPLGQDGVLARTWLEQRGFSAEVEAQGRELLRKNQAMPGPGIPALDEVREHTALEHLGCWYVEWSAICRVAIKDRTLLRALGLVTARTGQVGVKVVRELPALGAGAVVSRALSGRR